MINIIFLSESTNSQKLENIIKEYISKNISHNEKKSNTANLLIEDFLNYIYYFVLISKSDYRDNFYKQNFVYIIYVLDNRTNLLEELKKADKEVITFLKSKNEKLVSKSIFTE